MKTIPLENIFKRPLSTEGSRTFWENYFKENNYIIISESEHAHHIRHIELLKAVNQAHEKYAWELSTNRSNAEEAINLTKAQQALQEFEEVINQPAENPNDISK